MGAHHAASGAQSATSVRSKSVGVVDNKHVSSAESDIVTAERNGNLIYAAHCAEELIHDLVVSARALKEMGDLTAAREQVAETVRLVHRYDRYHLNESLENLIGTYYDYDLPIDEDDVKSIFELAAQMSDAAKESVHTPAILLLDEFFEKLKANSKRAADDAQHAYSARQADMASLTASRMGESYVSPSEVSTQAAYATEQYALAIDQELMKSGQQDGEDHAHNITVYIGRVRELQKSIRSSTELLRKMRKIAESIEPLAPIEDLHRGFGKD